MMKFGMTIIADKDALFNFGINPGKFAI